MADLIYVTITRSEAHKLAQIKIYRGGVEMLKIPAPRGLLLKLIKEIAEMLD